MCEQIIENKKYI